MANNTNPYDDALLDFSAIRAGMVRLFARDGVVCSDERKVLSMFDETTGTVKKARAIERTFEFLLRSKGSVSKYGQNMAKEAGLHITELHPDNNVVDFPNHDTGA